jgi:hypothetical protein
LQVLKKMYPEENSDTKMWIETLSKALRKAYPELNSDLPL